MYPSQLKTLDNAITTLQAIRNCQIENGDIHDHYDCREDMKKAVADLQTLLYETDADYPTLSDHATNTLNKLRNCTWLNSDEEIKASCQEVAVHLANQ